MRDLGIQSLLLADYLTASLGAALALLEVIDLNTGKTYTMGSAFAPGGSRQGVIPRVMDHIYAKITSCESAEFTVRVGFVEIHTVSPFFSLFMAKMIAVSSTLGAATNRQGSRERKSDLICTSRARAK